MRTILATVTATAVAATLAATLATSMGAAFAQGRNPDSQRQGRVVRETTASIPPSSSANRTIPPSAATSQGFFPIDTTNLRQSSR